jgi:hypothetical protein
MKNELLWWVKNIKSQVRIIDGGTPQVELFSDASLIGYDSKLGK